MASNFPTSLDVLTNPTGTDKVSVVDHASQHTNVNDIVEAIEAKVGIDSSAVTTSHDYKLTQITGSDYALGRADTATVTNKTIDGNNNTLTVLAASQLSGEVPVANGGTGRASHTAYAVVCGGTTSTADQQSIASVGTTGQILTSNGAGALPTFQAATGGAGSSLVYMSDHMNMSDLAVTTQPITTNTVANLSMFNITHSITVDKVSFWVVSTATAGTMDIAIFSEDGTIMHVSETTSSVSGTGVLFTHSFTPFALTPGNYYFYLAPNSTTDVTVRSMNPSVTTTNFVDTGSDEVLAGTLTVTADTVPATIDPTAISTATHNEFIPFRFN